MLASFLGNGVFCKQGMLSGLVWLAENVVEGVCTYILNRETGRGGGG